MKPAPPKNSAITLLEVLVIIVVLSVLVIFAIPTVSSGPSCSLLTGTLNNARQLHLAIQTMTLDTFNSGGNGIEWTSIVSKGKATKPATVAELFHALIDNNYLSKNDLKKLITAPGKGPGSADPTAANSCFRFFQVEEDCPSDQPLLVTINWQDRKLTNDLPYGRRGFVVFSKGGAGKIGHQKDAENAVTFPYMEGNYHFNTIK